MDENEYPDDEELEKIKNWPSTTDWRPLLAFVKERWKYVDDGYWAEGIRMEDDGKFIFDVYSISTAGWSGNEELLDAMRSNFMFWSMCWVQSRRGGHFVFECPRK